jgi:hypothetical protein
VLLHWRWAALSLLAFLYLAVPNARPDFTAPYITDSDHYLALAYNLAHGRGYTRSLPPFDYVAHKTWPPGFPLMLVPAMWASGSGINWFLVKGTMALVGLAGAISAWFLMRRLSGSTVVADLAAFMLLANPWYWLYSHTTMADMPYLSWMLFGLLVLDLAWAKRSVGPWEAVGTGLLAGLGMLIKGFCLGLALAPLAYFLGRRRSLGSTWAHVAAYAWFGLGFVTPQLLWMVRNSGVEAGGIDGVNQVQMLLQKDSNDPQSASAEIGDVAVMTRDNFRDQLIYRLPTHVVPGLWAMDDWAWRGSGWVAAILTAALLAAWFPWKDGPTSLHLAVIPAIGLIVIMREAYQLYYWVTPSMLFALGILLAASRIDWVRRRPLAWAIGLSILLAANLAGFIVRFERQPYFGGCDYADLARLFEDIRDQGLQSRGVLAPRSETFRLWTGCPAPLPLAGDDKCFQHCIVRKDWNGPRAPDGSRLIRSAGPWGLYELPRMMSAAELLPARHGLYALQNRP